MPHLGSFESGSFILAADYNILISDINEIYGLGIGNTGYGGNSANVVSVLQNLPSLTSGGTITNEQWIDLRNAMDDMASHQGTTLSNPLPLLTNLEDEDEIGFGSNAAPLFNSLNGEPPNNVTQLTANRFNSDLFNFETSTKLSSIRTTPWGTDQPSEPAAITHEFTVSFNDSDHARHFFNTSGNIQISASRTGGLITPQNLEWSNLLNIGSPYIFGGTEYFALTAGFLVVSTTFASPSTNYGDLALPIDERNRWEISARRDDAAGPNGGNGSIIRFKSVFVDGFLGPQPFASPPIYGPPDLVNGTLTSSISQKRSFEFFDIPTATYSSITQLNI